jgi:KaiC/GvpD/RAD55 family RecA-like ATPase
VAQNSYDRTDSNEKLDMLLKKLAMLENMVLMGDKVFAKESTGQMVSTLLQAKATIEKTEVVAGEIFDLEIEIANFGRAPATLEGIEEIFPCCGMELMTIPEPYHLDGSYLDLNGKVLESSMREKLRLTLRSLEKGTYVVTPRIVYSDAMGAQKILDLRPATVNVKEVILSGRVSTGYKDLDNLLFGGIPEKYAVVLSSISCDETILIINRFLEKGIREEGITLLVTVDASRWERLAEEFPNFHLFVCNPEAEITTKSLPNVVKLRGVESLTDISIPLFATLRKLEASNSKPRRICIDILSDILLQHHAVQTRRWLIGITTELKSKEFTTLAIINPHMHPPEEAQAVLDMFDGEMVVYEKKNQKFLRIKKMYEQNYIEDELPLRKDRLSTTGITRRLKYQHY